MNLARAALGCALAILVLAPAAHPQYMYLDSNGDGIHSAADQVNPAAPTTIDVWLDTDSNRDGSAAVCIDPGKPLSIFGYEFILHAVDGTVAWSDFVNRQPTLGVHFGEHMSSTDYYNAYIGYGPFLSPGLYRLASITVAAATGTPAVQIAASTPLGMGYATAFSSDCTGLDFDNTLKLGSDWFDVDGLPFGTPLPGLRPSLAQPADMSVPVGAVASQNLSASDPDGQPLAFAKQAGPPFLSVVTLEPGRGLASGQALAVPIYTNVGSTSATIRVSDGVDSDEKSFTVTVQPTPNRAPSMHLPDKMSIVAGTVAVREFSATDVDGQPLRFSKTSGPDWMELATLASGHGASVFGLRFSPTLCDVGTADAVVSVSDGSASAQSSVSILVTLPLAPPTPAIQIWPTDWPAQCVVVGDVNGDGRLDLLSAGGNSVTATVSVLLGHGDGTFDPPRSQVVAREAVGVAIGDLNGDGHPDLVAVSFADGKLTVLLGDGTGSFAPGGEYATGSMPATVLVADLDRDGRPDAVVGYAGSGYVTIYPGLGDGAFGPRRDIPAGGGPFGIAVGDFNRDGRSDLAVGNLAEHGISTLLARGDGSYALRPYDTGNAASMSIVAEDLNGDGVQDLAAALIGRVAIYIGSPDGSFEPGSAYTGLGDLYSIAAADLDGDGDLDLVAANPYGTVTVLYGAGDGTFPGKVSYAVSGNSVSIGDLNADGFPDVAVGYYDQGAITVLLNQNSRTGSVQARAFLPNPDRTVPLRSPQDLCLRLEPVNQSCSIADILPSSLTLASAGTGSITAIPSIPPKSAGAEDVDQNGIQEMPACFAGADLARLFDQVAGRRTVETRIQGSLLNGRRFCAVASLTVVMTGKALAVTVSPNPLNPLGTISFTTSRAGSIRIRLYDLHGRVIRTITEVPMASPGPHEYLFDARDDRGVAMASGVYFYRLETPEGTVRGRIAVLK